MTYFVQQPLLKSQWPSYGHLMEGFWSLSPWFKTRICPERLPNLCTRQEDCCVDVIELKTYGSYEPERRHAEFERLIEVELEEF